MDIHDIDSACRRASEHDWLENVVLYQRGGGDLNALCWLGFAMILLAAEHEQIDVARWLVEHGEINLPDSQGARPLHIAVDIDTDGAVQQRCPFTFRTTRAFLALGADPALTDRGGSSPRGWVGEFGLEALRLYDDVVRTTRAMTPTG